MTPPSRGPGGPSPLRRPDGLVQLGLGPGAWLVQGWDPDTCGPHDPATDLLRGLVVRPPVPDARVPWTVLGDGELARRLRGDSPAEEHGPVAPGDPPPVVLVSDYLVPVGSLRRADLAGRAVLPVVVQPARIVVGPWTGPGPGPCLHCLDLHRRDRDASWPALAAAFEDPRRTDEPPVHDPVVLDLACALTRLLVSAAVVDVPLAARLSYEVGAQSPHLVTRRWPVHPACPWHRSGGR